MKRDVVKEHLQKVAHSFNSTLGQFIFTSAGLTMMIASVAGLPLLFIATMVTACTLGWIFRHDLKS